MTPISSAPVGSLSTPALLNSLQEVQAKQGRLGESIAAANEIQAQIVKKDRARRRYERFAFLGNRIRNRALQRAEEQLRLEMDHVHAEEVVENARLGTAMDLGSPESSAFQRLVGVFDQLAHSEKIWDLTERGGRDHYRSPGSYTVDRKPVSVCYRPKPELSLAFSPLTFGNANGGDLLLYPSVLVVDDWKLKQIALIDLREVHLDFERARFIERETPPRDATHIDTTWEYVRNDGWPDQRFANNRQIPVMQYGQMTFRSNRGLYEVYQISNERSAEEFARQFRDYVKTLR